MRRRDASAPAATGPADRIDDTRQATHSGSRWRNGPVLDVAHGERVERQELKSDLRIMRRRDGRFINP